ncbi:MAG: ABC transporter permease, partial [Anaerolineae bacterium]|nr:ABC transporter permease [Anaerolineae bacterium]
GAHDSSPLVVALDRLFARQQVRIGGLLAIALCVAALALSAAALETVSHALAARQRALSGGLLVRPRGTSGADLAREVRLVPGVGAVAAGVGPMDVACEGLPWRTLRLWTVETDLAAWRFAPPIPGLKLAEGALPQSPDEVVVGHELARAGGLRPGSTLWLSGRAFRVVGIWQPGGLLAGNLVQVPLEAAPLVGLSGQRVDPIHVLLAPGADGAAVLAELRATLHNAVVLTPEEACLEERRLERALTVWVAVLGLLTALIAGPAGAEATRSAHEGRLSPALVAAVVAGLGGIGGLAVAWAAASVLNVGALRAHALTPLTLTPRVSLLAVAWAAGAGGLGGALALRRRAGELGRLARSGVAVGAIALAVLLALLAGGLEESLAMALQRTAAGNAGRLALFGRLSDSLLWRLQSLPGFRGAIAEAGGIALAEGEEGWPGRPPSGVLYGLLSADGSTGASVPYPVCLEEGRALEGPEEVILGWELAHRRGLRIGDRVSIRGRDLTVVGIRERWPLDALSPVNYRADVPLETYRRLSGDAGALDWITLLVPPAKDPQERSAYLTRVREQLPDVQITDATHALRRVASAFPGGGTLRGDDPVARAQGLYQRLLVICVAGGLFVCGVAVANALWPSCREQRAEIGLVRLLGALPGEVLAGYLWSGLAMGVVGSLLGCYMAWQLVSALNAIFRGSQVLPALWLTPRLAAAVVALTLAGCVLGAAAPGLQAAGVNMAWLTKGLASSRGEPVPAGSLRESRS